MMRALRPGTGPALRIIAAGPAGVAVALVLVLPGPRWTLGLVFATVTALGLAIGWIWRPRPILATGTVLAIVGGLAVHPVGPPASVLVALCVGGFLLSAEAAEAMVWSQRSGAEISLTAAVLEMVQRLGGHRWPMLTALIAVAAIGLGVALPVAAAPVIVVFGAIAIGLLCWWAAAPRWPR